MPDWLPKAIRK